MAEKLKLGPLVDDKPVKLNIELPAAVFRDLQRYGEILGGVAPIEPVKLIGPMLARFMATDRAFAKARKGDTGRDPHSVVGNTG